MGQPLARGSRAQVALLRQFRPVERAVAGPRRALGHPGGELFAALDPRLRACSPVASTSRSARRAKARHLRFGAIFGTHQPLLAAELDADLMPRRVQRALACGRLERSELDQQPVSLGSQGAQCRM
jgi:hypothetical protein